MIEAVFLKLFIDCVNSCVLVSCKWLWDVWKGAKKIKGTINFSIGVKAKEQENTFLISVDKLLFN